MQEPRSVAGETSPNLSRFGRYFVFQMLAGLLAAVGVMLLFRWIGREAFGGETLAFDETIRLAIHQISSPGLTYLFIAISFIGSPEFLVGLGVLIVCCFLYFGWRRAAVLFLVTMAGEIILDLTLKEFYARPRPQAFFDYTLPSSFSFPSGHALGSFCFYGIVAWLLASKLKCPAGAWSIRISAIFLIFLIGFSRVYLGVHYPTDVLAGYLTGFVWTATVISNAAFLKARKPR